MLSIRRFTAPVYLPAQSRLEEDKMPRLMFVLMALLLAGPLVADEEEAPVPATLGDLQAAIVEVMEDAELPAVGIALVDSNGPVWVDALGKANLEADVDADADTLFRIGSTSKMFVALAVLKLVEEGRLSLDDKLAELAPEIAFQNPWEDSDPVRIVHLLEHTTGWDDIHLPEYAHNDPKPASLREGLDFHPHSRVSRWKPGSRMAYCNSGPPVAAYIVQKVTGIEFEQYVQEVFFEPMGMTTMTYRYSDDVVAKGVTSYANGNVPQDYWHIIMRPSGSINASPRDMARLVALFLNRGVVNGRQLVSASSLSRMETAGSTPAARAGQEVGYGLHNYSSVHEHWVYRAHDGGVNGGLTEMAYLPEAGAGHAIMVNSDDFVAFRKISDLVRKFETRELVAAEVRNNSALTADHLSIEGFYYPINSRQQVSYFLDRIFGVQVLAFTENTLYRKALLGGEPTNYYAVSPDAYRHAETGMISLTRVVDPLAGAVVHAGTLVMKPVSSLVVYGQLGIAVLWALMIASSLIYAVVWGARKWRGKVPGGATIRVRVWPLLASLSIVMFVGLFMLGMAEPFSMLGKPTFYSVGVMLSSIAFAVFAVLSARAAIKERHGQMNRVNYWHSAIASMTHSVVALYLLWFGVIGLMTWA